VRVGEEVGSIVGLTDGLLVVGNKDGVADGLIEGSVVGIKDGINEGPVG
jgi:hypothetical protein